jgi:asparagine synthase (glutamine-hydrolysing)
MCGIFGVLNTDRSPSAGEGRLAAIAGAMKHRGPDAHGFYTDHQVALVHTRLSLVDLSSRSDQPLWDRSGRYCIVYNGELYGYENVRSQLEDRGVVFATTSDTEVLLYAVLEFGVDQALSELDGMFAFAIYDRLEGSLVLARDRIGMKPLFTWRSQGEFAFSSTVQAFRSLFTLEPDLLSVQTFLSGYGGPTSGRSFFKGVQIVSPGTIVTLRKGEHPTCRSFASWKQLESTERLRAASEKKPEQWIDELEELLLRSVESQMLSDVPVGALCSGGVDSSLTLAMAKKFNPDLKVFHADVCGPLSEVESAKQVAEHLDLPIHIAEVRDQDFIQSIPEITEHFGFPFLFHPNSVPFVTVCKLVRESGVKAVLCGEGADELFLGYEWLIPNIRRTISRFPSEVFHYGKTKIDEWERQLRGKPPIRSFGKNDHQLVRSLSHAFEYELGIDEIDPDSESQLEWPSANDRRSLVRCGELSYILRTLMHRNDSLGMSSSIEARYPFLARDVLEFAINLPTTAKLRVSTQLSDWHHPFVRDKWVLRKVASRYLPLDAAHRVKRPFKTSAFDRMRISPAYFDRSPLQDWFQVTKARLRFMADNASAALRMRMLMLDVWGRLYFQGEKLPGLQSRLNTFIRVAGSSKTAANQPEVLAGDVVP